MESLSKDFIKQIVADSYIIFERGEKIYQFGSYFLSKENLEQKEFTYRFDGNFGNYKTKVLFNYSSLETSCTCPYPGEGCKHVVAAALNARDILIKKGETQADLFQKEIPYLSEAEIRELALNDREKRAKSEAFTLNQGDMIKGDHLVVSKKHKKYRVTLHDPFGAKGHCSCPDYMTNRLGTCKHIHYLVSRLKEEKDFSKRAEREKFPFIDLYWDSVNNAPMVFAENLENESDELQTIVKNYFDTQGKYRSQNMNLIMDFINEVYGSKRVRVRETMIKRIAPQIMLNELAQLSCENMAEPELKTQLYPYQKKGVQFGLLKPAVLIGDEMGLGKTLQAITLGIMKKDLFGFSRVLIITLASLKEQWKREIEKFTGEKAAIVEGNPNQRKNIYYHDDALFKITNYEAVLRDVLVLSKFSPDLIILDEAQRIKNFSTKTADAVKSIPKKHAVVLTGTPLENKLEDVYSIVQFLDPFMLAPLWQFACDHFLIPKNKKSAVAGYKNLDKLNEKLKSIVIRRKKEEVLKDLPREVVNNFYVELTDEQSEIHSGFARVLLPLLNKKFLTPVDIRRIQMLLLKMRQVCDSTYLIDRETQISPKLKELEGIIDEIVVQNNRKMVIFSEWTTMTYLIARSLSDMGIAFVELSGKVPVKKRQSLIDEFTDNPDCRVFLSTDAGGTGLNLQTADCVVNFELPWNPARLNQRIGRVNRIGQSSQCVNVINLIARKSIEEKIFATIQLKNDLFKGVFDGGPDTVEFSREKRNEMLNRLRQMMGEEPEPAAAESEASEEIPEDTPYFLNPEVLGRDEETDPETALFDPQHGAAEDSREAAADEYGSGSNDQNRTNIFVHQPPEKIENVLNSGMQFMAGLMEMATGQKMEISESQDKMIKIDRETGEITMKFKLPGF